MNVGSMSFSFVARTLGKVVSTTESNLDQSISSMGSDPTTQDLLLVQSQIAQWSLITGMSSTITKSVQDTINGILQKAG
jgi:type III secretion apparatus needle protein